MAEGNGNREMGDISARLRNLEAEAALSRKRYHEMVQDMTVARSAFTIVKAHAERLKSLEAGQRSLELSRAQFFGALGVTGLLSGGVVELIRLAITH